MPPVFAMFLGVAISLALFLCGAFAVEPTRLHNVRFGEHPNFSRLVFDAQGAHPFRMEHAPEGGLMLRFHRLDTSLASRIDGHRSLTRVKNVEILRVGEDGRIWIPYDDERVDFKYEYLAAPSYGRSGYRLVFDFRTAEKNNPGENSPSAERVTSPEEAPEGGGPVLEPASGTPPLEEVHAEDNKGEHVPGAFPAVETGKDFLACLEEKGALMPENSHGQVEEAFHRCVEREGKGEQWRLLAAYLFAEAHYQENEERLAHRGAEVLAALSRALNAGHLPERTPPALFYSGRTCMAMGDWRRAEVYFMQLVEDYPQHPLAGRAWLKLARIYSSAESFVESLQAARQALDHSLTRPRRAQAYFLLGKGHYMLGDSGGAVENYERCLQEEPSHHLKEPQLLRELGESHFSLGNHQKSNDHLFHYLNLLGTVPDLDMVLARVAENLTFLEESSLADRLRNHVTDEYPHTEGAVIAQLRVAEAYETRAPAQPELARAIYEEVLRSHPNHRLRGLAKLKLAAWHWKHGCLEESLQIIREALAGGEAGNSAGEFIRVKEKVLETLIGDAFSNGDHQEVVTLYSQNESTVKGLGSPALMTQVAESHAALRLYSEAVALLEELLENDHACQESYLKLARYNFLTGRVQKAEGYLSKVGSQWAEDKKRLSGEMAAAGGDHSRAVGFFSGILRDVSAATREDLQWIPIYADSLLKSGRPLEALKWAEGSLELVDEGGSDREMELNLLRVAALEQLKRWEEAAGNLEAILALGLNKEREKALTYRLSGIYQKAGMEALALERLASLSESSDPFWQSVAEQQLDYISLRKNGLLEF